MDQIESARLEGDLITGANTDPTMALQAVTGMRVDSLVYNFKVGGTAVSGITVKGAKALMARRGGLEVLPAEIGREKMLVLVGNEVEETEAYRATVRVRDTQSDVTFIASVTEPAVMVKRDGTVRLDPMADRKAIAKATRNAILDHFAAVEDVVTGFVNEQIQAGRAFVLEDKSADAEQASEALKRQKAQRESQDSIPIGGAVAKIYYERVIELAQAAGVDEKVLSNSFLGWLARKWPGLKLPQLPTRSKADIDAWLTEQAKALGVTEAIPETPALVPTPAAEAPAQEPAPTPAPEATPAEAAPEAPAQPAGTMKQLQEAWNALKFDEAQIAAVYTQAGVDATKKAGPEEVARLQEATMVVAGQGTPTTTE